MYRIGQSQDIHRLIEGRELYLGGIKIPYSKGLLGHSDADVLLHAITESIIGALGLGDLGDHFPDSDLKYKGCSSIKLLNVILEKMNSLGFEIVNLDTIIIAEEPKLNGHKKMIKDNLINLLNTSKINVKATTAEKLDAIGSGNAICAQAVVLLKEK